jgi:hypothetical protein
LWSERWQEIISGEGETDAEPDDGEREGEWTRAWHSTLVDLTGQKRRPLSDEDEPLQEIVTTSPEGHSNERSSTTPAAQSVSKYVRFDSESEADECNKEVLEPEMAEERKGSGWCIVALREQSVTPLRLTRHGELSKVTYKGSDSWDSVTLSFTMLPILGIGCDTSLVVSGLRVSEIVTRKGLRSEENILTDCWEELAVSEPKLFANDSKFVSGIERGTGEKEEERKKDEERRYGLTLDWRSWASNISEVTNSLYSLNNDTSNDTSSASETASRTEELLTLDTAERRDEFKFGDARPDTHKSNTFTSPDSVRSSTDKPTSRERRKISTASPPISRFKDTLKLIQSDPINDRALSQDLTLLASAFSFDISSPTLATNKPRMSIACDASSALNEHEDDPT